MVPSRLSCKQGAPRPYLTALCSDLRHSWGWTSGAAHLCSADRLFWEAAAVFSSLKMIPIVLVFIQPSPVSWISKAFLLPFFTKRELLINYSWCILLHEIKASETWECICSPFSLSKITLLVPAIWQFFFYPFLILFLQIKVTMLLFTQPWQLRVIIDSSLHPR